MAANMQVLKEQIRSGVNIVDVVGRYVQLRKSGRNLKGLCPFHHEDTPSFQVDPEEGLYHCFGCKAGGDVFSFLMQMEGLTFREALARLAEQVGVALPEGKNADASGQAGLANAHLYEVNQLAADFYHNFLMGSAGKSGRLYLTQRGITGRTAERFHLGFAPDSWQALSEMLHKAGKMEFAARAGLVVVKEERRFDLLRNRIVFPVTDASGRIVAFGGRDIGGRQPKYMNSPETPLFVKRRQLYGLSQARDEIRRSGRALVVEGFFDCVAMQQYGVGYAVATCGTALTPEHIGQLRRLGGHELYICFDADAAGRAGVSKGLAAVDEAGLVTRVVLLPAGDDPDSFVRREGTAGFLGYLEKALPLRDYLLEEAMSGCDLHSLPGRMQAVRAALPVLRGISSPLERDLYTQRLAARLNLPYASLTAEIAARGGAAAGRQHTNREIRNTSRDFMPSPPSLLPMGTRRVAERELLRCLMQDCTGIGCVSARLGEAPFTSETYNVVFQALAAGKTTAATVAELDDQQRETVMRELVTGGEITSLTWQDCLTKLRMEQMREDLEAMEEGLATLVDQNPVQFMTQWRESLLAFRRWLNLAHADTGGKTALEGRG